MAGTVYVIDTGTTELSGVLDTGEGRLYECH
jgi:hypothetical protein